jgi:hypothetical protein
MSSSARIYIATVIAVGVLSLLWTLGNWRCANVPMFVAYATIGLFAAGCKVRLPNLTGTISVNFLFVLIGVAEFSLAETMLLGCASTLVQTFWRARTRPSTMKAAFNFTALAVSIAVAHGVSHLIMGSQAHVAGTGLLLCLATVLLYVTNTFLVSGAVSLVDAKPFFEVWQSCFLWSFPYYGIGAAIAGIIASSVRSVGPYLALAALPAVYLAYLYYRLVVERATAASVPAVESRRAARAALGG